MSGNDIISPATDDEETGNNEQTSLQLCRTDGRTDGNSTTAYTRLASRGKSSLHLNTVMAMKFTYGGMFHCAVYCSVGTSETI